MPSFAEYLSGVAMNTTPVCKRPVSTLMLHTCITMMQEPKMFDTVRLGQAVIASSTCPNSVSMNGTCN